jgi:hypothetical protein
VSEAVIATPSHKEGLEFEWRINAKCWLRKYRVPLYTSVSVTVRRNCGKNKGILERTIDTIDEIITHFVIIV